MEINEIESPEEALTRNKISVFEELTRHSHEQIVYCHDEPTGLKAIIGIHDTTLGPSLGGTRMWPYQSEREALFDVLRLSRGMTFKAAITGLNVGGGKAVIIGDAEKIKNEALMRRFGRFIDSLGGKYITAEDVNMKTRDMQYIAMETKHVTGLPEIMGGGGDPSPVTAYGTYVGMKAAAKKVFGQETLRGKKIAVQGVGQVGKHLIEHLSREKAEIVVSDLSREKTKEVSEKFKVKVVAEGEIYSQQVDIYSPCALGASLNDLTIEKLKCKIVAGAANNQLFDEVIHGKMLQDEGIVYIPDFVINAGGLINVYLEHLGDYSRDLAYQMAENIYENCLNVMKFSESKKITPQEAAMKIAMKRINDIAKVKLKQ